MARFEVFSIAFNIGIDLKYGGTFRFCFGLRGSKGLILGLRGLKGFIWLSKKAKGRVSFSVALWWGNAHPWQTHSLTHSLTTGTTSTRLYVEMASFVASIWSPRWSIRTCRELQHAVPWRCTACCPASWASESSPKCRLCRNRSNERARRSSSLDALATEIHGTGD